MKLSSFSILIWSVVLIIIGISLVPLLNVQLSPTRSQEAVKVDYFWPDASARIIEQEVTSKLEGVFSGIKGLKDISSVTSKGNGSIDLTFKKNVSLDAVRFEISTLIRRVYEELPEQVSYPQLSIGFSGRKTSTILSYTLNASASSYYIQQYAEKNLVPALASVNGVNDVKVYGATRYEYVISYDPDKLNILGLEASQLATAINSYYRQDALAWNENSGIDAGYNSEIRVVLCNSGFEKQEWREIPIGKSGDRVVHLGEVAVVRYQEQIPDNYYRINGLNAVFMVISAVEGTNTLTTAGNVKKAIGELMYQLPPGYSIILANDYTEFLSTELRTIAFRSVASLLVLMLFVFLVSRRRQYVMLIAFSMLANLAIAVIFYYLLRLEIHLYSLAGISVSFGMIITNSIVMIDHYRYHRNKSVFIAILAATLTTIGSLCVIFFLQERDRINLVDFAWVMIINLSVSMAIALWFIPSLMEKIRLNHRSGRFLIRKQRRIVRFSHVYATTLLFTRRFRWAFILLLILGFGIPLHRLPDKIEKETQGARIYNSTLGSNWFQKRVRPKAEKILGGSLRLFSGNIGNQSFYREPQRTTLYITGSMPEGCTVQQLNEAMLKMENYISRYAEVESFETSIYSYDQGNIQILFKKEFENTGFPFQLKEALTTKAIGLGGVDWGIYGVGQGFSNALNVGFLSNRIVLEGFNYDQLYGYANDLIVRLKKNQRVGKIEITGDDAWGSQVLTEYFMTLNPKAIAYQNLNLQQYYGFLRERLYRQRINPVHNNEGVVPVVLVSEDFNRYNTWWIKNGPVTKENGLSKLLYMGNISKQRMGNDIYRVNQQYRLIVAYEFIGPGELARRVYERNIKETATMLPLGYKVSEYTYSWWWPEKAGQYYLILIVLAIIYLICAVLLESLTQPLAIMALIPLSFIGVFLTFHIFSFSFDQGGFASFILLAGVAVNSGLFIINDYNHLKSGKKPTIALYIKAYNQKIIPVMLTILTTIIGLIPFVWGGQQEVFWFAFAAGTIGGLIFSIIGLVIFQPLFLKMGERR